MAKDPAKKPRLARVLLQAAAAIRATSYLVYPVMPGSVEKIWALLGEGGPPSAVPFKEFRFEDLGPDRTYEEPRPLFQRIALKDFLGEEPASPLPDPEAEKPTKEKQDTMDIVTFDEFKRMDFRVAEVLEAERIPGATKILKLKIGLGTEQRTMIAGIAETYAPEDLVGKKIVVIVNLKPAVIRGIESQAMLLAAVIDDKAVVPFFDRDVPAGAEVK
jgi:methionyl-tRNA synthetase